LLKNIVFQQNLFSAILRRPIILKDRLFMLHPTRLSCLLSSSHTTLSIFLIAGILASALGCKQEPKTINLKSRSATSPQLTPTNSAASPQQTPTKYASAPSENSDLGSSPSSSFTSPEPPKLLALTPKSNNVNPLHTTITAAFSTAVRALTNSDFALRTGTGAQACQALPIVEKVSMSADSKTASATLSKGSCLHGQTLTVTVNSSAIFDLHGSAGTSGVLSATYTLLTTGPQTTLALDADSSSSGSGTSSRPLNKDATATLVYSYRVAGSNVEIKPASNPVAVNNTDGTVKGITIVNTSGTVSCPLTVTSTSASPLGGTIKVGPGCSGVGAFSLHVNAATASDNFGNLSTASPDITIAVQASPVTVNFNAASKLIAVNTAPQNLEAHFSVPVITSSTDYSLSGTCSGISAVNIAPPSSPTTKITIPLTGISCNYRQNLTLAISATNKIQDIVGNTLALPLPGAIVLSVNDFPKPGRYLAVTDAAANNVSWGAAQDDRTAPQNLEYRIIYAKNHADVNTTDLTAISNRINQGIVFGDLNFVGATTLPWSTEGVTTKTLSIDSASLTDKDQRHYAYAVLIRDGDGAIVVSARKCPDATWVLIPWQGWDTHNSNADNLGILSKDQCVNRCRNNSNCSVWAMRDTTGCWNLHKNGTYYEKTPSELPPNGAPSYGNYGTCE
jgi:hypothetical protein